MSLSRSYIMLLTMTICASTVLVMCKLGPALKNSILSVESAVTNKKFLIQDGKQEINLEWPNARLPCMW